MENKKIIAIAIVLALVMLPSALMFIPKGETYVESADINPVKGYELSAVPSYGSTVVSNADAGDKLYGGALKVHSMNVHLVFDAVSAAVNASAAFGSLFTVVWNTTLALPVESSTGTGVTLGTLANTTTASGTTLNFTIPFTLAWTVTDADNLNMVWASCDSAVGGATVATTYDVESTLVLTSTNFISLSDYGTGKMIVVSNMVFSYTSSSALVFPLDAQTDFYLTRTPSSGVLDTWNPTGYTDGTGVAIWADIIAGSVPLVETFTVAAYTQGGSTTNLMSTTYTDTVTLTNDGQGADPPDPTGLSPNTMVLLGIVAVIAFLCWRSSKEDATVAKRKPAKRKRKK